MVAHHASPGTRRGASRRRRAAVHAALTRRCARRCSISAPRAGCPAATCRRSGRRCSRAAPDGRRRPTGASAGTRPTATSSTSTSSMRRTPAAPLLVLFHGLEGSSASHYALAFAHRARARGWRYRGAAFPRLLGRAEPGAARLPLGRLRGDRLDAAAPARAQHGAAAGRWASRSAATRCCAGPKRPATAAAATAARWPRCRSPIDLAAGGHAIGRGFNRQVYTRMFLRTMKAKALAKLAQHPGLFDRERLRAARTLYEFDNVFTAPLHGFRDTDDYWARALGQAAPAPHPHPGAGAERAQRPLRAGVMPARGARGRALRHAVAAGARRACRLPARALSRPCAGPARRR